MIRVRDNDIDNAVGDGNSVLRQRRLQLGDPVITPGQLPRDPIKDVVDLPHPVPTQAHREVQPIDLRAIDRRLPEHDGCSVQRGVGQLAQLAHGEQADDDDDNQPRHDVHERHERLRIRPALTE